MLMQCYSSSKLQRNRGSCRPVLFSSLRDAIIFTVSLDTLPPTGVRLSLYICAGNVHSNPKIHFLHVTKHVYDLVSPCDYGLSII